eukprot:COSAG01_NODE_61342_length_290_cov_0.696335_1_plen_62_part_01
MYRERGWGGSAVTADHCVEGGLHARRQWAAGHVRLPVGQDRTGQDRTGQDRTSSAGVAGIAV